MVALETSKIARHFVLNTHTSDSNTLVNVRNSPAPELSSAYVSIGYCGNNINSNSYLTTGCTFACNANSNEICGGSNVLDMYQNNGESTTPNSSSTPSSSTLTSSSTTTSATITPSTVPMITGPYTFQGCYKDIPGRALTDAADTNAGSATVCQSFYNSTLGGSYTYFGIEYLP